MPEMPNIDIRPDHWEIVKNILQKHVPQYEVWAFGSRAKWTAKEYSDLDLAIITDQPLSLDISAILSDAFSESDLPWRVDVVDWATTSESFKKIIERDKVVVQEGKKGLGVRGEWRECSLGEVIELKRGYDLPQKDRRPGDIPIVSSSGVTDTHVEAMVKGPGVVTGRYGTLGQVYYVEQDYWPLNTTLYVRDFKGNDPRFISYFLRNFDFLAYSDKAAVPGLNRNHLHQARVKIPADPTEQRAIAHILGTLDDKIELNRQQNETLEAMARALFKAWFVDFEPVRAKMEGRWQRGQSLPGLPAHLYDLFPDRLVESELGEIPEGWPIVSFGDIALQGKGSVSPGESPQDSFTHYSLPAFDAGQMPVNELGEAIKSNKTPVPDGAVLISKLNPHIPRVWLVGKAGDNAVCSTEFIVWTPKAPANSAFLYCLASSAEFNTAMRQLVTGTSNSHQRVKPEQLRDIRCIAANFDAIKEFSTMVLSWMNQFLKVRQQSRTLAQLRDTLLPKLISGELRVKDAEAFLKEKGL